MKEEDNRKRGILDKYLALVIRDIKGLFNFKSFQNIKCPACDSNELLFEFDKHGFKYVSCNQCATLFVNPRPPFETLKNFYSDSPSTSFFVNEFFKTVLEIRRLKIFKPRAEYISNMLVKNKNMVIGDIGAGFGLFLEEMKKILPGNHYIAIEPSVEMADICGKYFDIKCMCLEDIIGLEGNLIFSLPLNCLSICTSQ